MGGGLCLCLVCMQVFFCCFDKNEYVFILISLSLYESVLFCDNYYLKYLFCSFFIIVSIFFFMLCNWYLLIIIKIFLDLYLDKLKCNFDQVIINWKYYFFFRNFYEYNYVCI